MAHPCSTSLAAVAPAHASVGLVLAMSFPDLDGQVRCAITAIATAQQFAHNWLAARPSSDRRAMNSVHPHYGQAMPC
eukprot:9943749-Alexandrium_andersonii.AAC.1